MLLASFPLPRYFQIHFQHIHERTDQVHQELTELKIYVNNLETKLDALLMLLAHEKYRKNVIRSYCLKLWHITHNNFIFQIFSMRTSR